MLSRKVVPRPAKITDIYPELDLFFDLKDFTIFLGSLWGKFLLRNAFSFHLLIYPLIYSVTFVVHLFWTARCNTECVTRESQCRHSFRPSSFIELNAKDIIQDKKILKWKKTHIICVFWIYVYLLFTLDADNGIRRIVFTFINFITWGPGHFWVLVKCTDESIILP